MSEEKVVSDNWELDRGAVFLVGSNTFTVDLFGTGSEEQKDESNLCKVCYNNEFNVVLTPCGHCLCDECSKNFKDCHICREPIVSFVKVYKA